MTDRIKYAKTQYLRASAMLHMQFQQNPTSMEAIIKNATLISALHKTQQEYQDAKQQENLINNATHEQINEQTDEQIVEQTGEQNND
jgi:hypothetical protein